MSILNCSTLQLLESWIKSNNSFYGNTKETPNPEKLHTPHVTFYEDVLLLVLLILWTCGCQDSTLHIPTHVTFQDFPVSETAWNRSALLVWGWIVPLTAY